MVARGESGDRLVLAELAPFGDVEELRAQVRAQARATSADGRRRDQFEGADPSDSIRVSVDGRGRVVDLDVSRHWAKRIPADAVAEAVWQAYVSAAQQAMSWAATVALTAPVSSTRRGEPAGGPGDADREVDEGKWLAGVWATLDESRSTLNRLVDRSTTALDERALKSPNGLFTLRLAGAGVVGISGDTRLIRAADAGRLRWEALAVFRAAGVTGGDQPST